MRVSSTRFYCPKVHRERRLCSTEIWAAPEVENPLEGLESHGILLWQEMTQPSTGIPSPGFYWPSSFPRSHRNSGRDRLCSTEIWAAPGLGNPLEGLESRGILLSQLQGAGSGPCGTQQHIQAGSSSWGPSQQQFLGLPADSSSIPNCPSLVK